MVRKAVSAKSTNPSTNDKHEPIIQVLKKSKCPTNSGKSTLEYLLGTSDAGEIYLKITSNTGGGFFTSQWLAYSDIQAALEAWPKEQPISSMAFRQLSKGRSSNNAGFTCALLAAEGLLEPDGKKQRLFQVADPTRFLAQVEQLRQPAGKKPATKAKTPAKAIQTPSPAKAKASATGNAKTVKTPRKSTAASRKGK